MLDPRVGGWHCAQDCSTEFARRSPGPADAWGSWQEVQPSSDIDMCLKGNPSAMV